MPADQLRYRVAPVEHEAGGNRRGHVHALREMTLPIARQHCASFEKVPQLRDAGDDTAIFDCVKR